MRRGLALVFALALVLTACTGGGSSPPANESQGLTGPPGSADLDTVSVNAYRIGVVSRATLDPAAVLPTNQAEMIAADLLFDSLTAIDPQTGAARPAAAFTWTVNDAQTTWRFAVGRTKFSDGRPVTAGDVKASLERVAKQQSDECKRQNPDVGTNGTSGQCPSLAGLRLDVIDGYREFLAGVTPDIRGIQAIDDGTVQIETREPFSPLAELLASPIFGIVPKDAGSTADFEKNLVTSGPYKISQRSDAIVRLEKSRDNPSPTAVDRIELVHFFTLDGSYKAFTDGKLDWTQVPQEKVAEAKSKFGDSAIKPFNAEQFFGINLGNAAYTNEKFRQAMLKAVDRSALVDKVLPGRTKLNGSVPPGVPGVVDDPCGAACVADPPTAKALLAEAFPDGNVPPVEIEVYDDPSQTAMAESLRQQWAAVGISATVAVKSVEEFPKFVVSGEQQVFGIGWVGLYPDPDAYLAPLFLSGSLDNLTNFSSPELDGGLKEARAIADREARIAKYADMQRLVMQQLPIIPIAAASTNAVVSKRVRGYAGRLDGTFDVDKLELDIKG
ncbi:MAG: ABC transporter substrate-binding protein [Actinobacteria bacterium]|nr:ABC transporter substrate-binding protein [Actinomycetota bacterium]